MKKKLLSLLLTLSVALSMMPMATMTAFAKQDNVAKIGGAKYPTLQAAIDAAEDDDTIVLLKNAKESIVVHKKITINLDKYNIDARDLFKEPTENGYVIYVDGDLTITGKGMITGGNNTGNGGGIYLADKKTDGEIVTAGKVTLSGASQVTGNKAGGFGGGIYNDCDCNKTYLRNIMIGGSAKVIGNVSGVSEENPQGFNDNIYLKNRQLVKILKSAETKGRNAFRVGISQEEPGYWPVYRYVDEDKESTDIVYDTDYYGCVVSDDPTFDLRYNTSGHSAGLFPYAAKIVNKNVTTYYDTVQEAIDTIHFSKAGLITMVHDSAIKETVKVGRNQIITLDLNGHNLNRSLDRARKAYDGIVLHNEGNLTIVNNTFEKNEEFGYICNGGGVYTDADGQTYQVGGILNDGTLKLNTGVAVAGNDGYGVFNRGNLYMEDAYVIENYVGGVCNAKGYQNFKIVNEAGIYDNVIGWKNDASCNVAWEDDAVANIEVENFTGKCGITAPLGTEFAQGEGVEAFKDNFFSDNEEYEIGYDATAKSLFVKKKVTPVPPTPGPTPEPVDPLETEKAAALEAVLAEVGVSEAKTLTGELKMVYEKAVSVIESETNAYDIELDKVLYSKMMKETQEFNEIKIVQLKPQAKKKAVLVSFKTSKLVMADRVPVISAKYQIKRATNKKFTKGVKTNTKKASKKSKLTYKSKKLKKGKRYYYKVRGVITFTDGTTIHTKWSKVKSAKAK